MKRLKTSGILFIIALFIIIFIIIGYFAIQKKERAIITNAIEAVPVDACLILELTDFQDFAENVKTDSSLITKILTFNQVSDFNNQIFSLNSLIKSSKIFEKVFDDQKIIISAHLNTSKKIDYLIALKIPKTKLQKKFIKEIVDSCKITDTSSIVRNYNDTKIYNIVLNEKKFYFSVIENIFIFSKSQLLLEKAIRQKLSHNPISLDIGFKKTSKTISKNKIHLFINYSHFPGFAKLVFNSSFSKKIKKISNIADWSAFDFNFDENFFYLNGYTYTKPNSNFFLYMFNKNTPEKFEDYHIFPYKTAQFITFNIQNFPDFFSGYQKYISSKNLAGYYSQLITDFNIKNKTKIESEILPQIDNSISFLKVKFNKVADDFSNFAVIKIKNQNQLSEIFNNIAKKYSSDINDFTFNYKLDNSTNLKYYKLPAENFLKIFFGELVQLEQMQYYFFFEDYLIFAENNKDLEKYYYSLYSKKTLSENSKFNEYSKKIPNKFNIFYYMNNDLCSYNNTSLLNKKFEKIYSKNSGFFNKFQFVSLQFIFEKNNLFQTHINAFYNKKLSNKGISIWEKKIRSNIKNKPYFFTNHYTYENELLIADDSNNVYLIDNKGDFIFSKHINDPFVDNFHSVDLYNNNKFQVMFATKNNIITLDRNGKYLEEKSTTLPASTNKGLTIADYDGNKDYRIFVPCTNKKIYLFNKDLKQIKGWKIPQTQAKIVSKVYHFLYEGKDYIVFGDKIRPYILNRRGEERIEVKENVSLPNNCSFYFQEKTNDTKAGFVTSDASGKIVFIDLFGNVKYKELITLSAKHHFEAFDFDNDKNLDYVFVDDKTLFVYNFSGSKIFSHTFSAKILGKPIILKFSENDIQIGVTIAQKNKIYIFHSNGTIRNNFPLNGNSLFSVRNFSSNKNFSLVVGLNNYVYNYLLY